jgi:hypothetical protein
LGDALTETVVERLEWKAREDASRSGAAFFRTEARLDLTMAELKGELAAFKTDLMLWTFLAHALQVILFIAAMAIFK